MKQPHNRAGRQFAQHNPALHELIAGTGLQSPLLYIDDFDMLESTSTIYLPAQLDSSGSLMSMDSEASRDRSLLSPLVLDRSQSHGMPEIQKSSTGLQSNANELKTKREKTPMEIDESEESTTKFVKRPSPSSLVDLHLKESMDSKTPYHITSIHPSKVTGSASMLRSRQRFRNRSEDFGRRGQPHHDEAWDSNFEKPLGKKPLGEFLNPGSISNPMNPKQNNKPINRSTNEAIMKAVSRAHEGIDADEVSKEEINENRRPANVVDENKGKSGCLACDKCFPGGRPSIVPLTDSRDYTAVPPKERRLSGSKPLKSTRSGHFPIISWFTSKKKSEASAAEKQKAAIIPASNLPGPASLPPNGNRGKMTTTLDDNNKGLQITVDSMKQEVSEANRKRDAAMAEVFELKSAIHNMGKKLEELEHRYQSLNYPSKKIGSFLAGSTSEEYYGEEDGYELPRISSSWGGAFGGGTTGPSKKEFCHAVVEARVGVKQFCRTLLQQLHKQSALDRIDTMLQAQNLKTNVSIKGGTVSKRVKYLVESLVNQSFYEDFENIKFKKNGSHCVLDPRQRPPAFYKAYMGISQVGWSELVSKDSSAFSESFDEFCDQKMNKLVEEVLYWDLEGGWPDDLLKAFFVAAKWVWLLHLLAFSFEQPSTIFRVSSEAHYDPLYMEELPGKDSKFVDESSRIKRFGGLHASNGNSAEHEAPNILAMVMPGFFFNSFEVIRCKVLLSSVVR